jgi:hypothetical protein
MSLRHALTTTAALFAFALSFSAQARIVRLEVVRTDPAFNGQSYGDPGPYQRIIARAYGEVDPADPKNAIIQDLNLAPRDVRGMVEYSTAVEILKPVDMSRGSGVLLFEVVNRGNKLAFGNFHDAVSGPIADRNGLKTPGDGFLLKEGHTIVWWGWEMDVRAGMNRVLMPPVLARNSDGSNITGLVRSEIITPRETNVVPISLSQQIQLFPPDSYDGYPTANVDNRTPFADGFLPTLTVRTHEQEPRTQIPNSEWTFGTCEGDQEAKADDKHLCYKAGFKPGHLYELIYRAKDPTVLALGFAATRDLGAFLHGSEKDSAGNPNPVYRPGQRTIIAGSSQSGRMIRSFLHLGFNQDETGKRVFDGAFPHIGGGLMPLNVRFGQPVRAWGEQTDHTYPAYEFPFTYGRQFDPLTMRTQGVLDRCAASETCPRIFHVATVLEMWEGRQSLGLTDPLGMRDVEDPSNVRTYIMASTQHGAAPLPLATKPPFGNCQQQPNPNPQVWTMRALLRDLVQWVRDDAAPPPSTVPRIGEGTLVPADQVRLPNIPANTYGGAERAAVSRARVFNNLHVVDFGPQFRPEDESGIITQEPPKVGSATYGVLEPQVDADGNDIGGIRSVFVEAPIGTYTGWNLNRKDRFENGMCNLQGSFIPFAATRAEREAAGDPRLSLEERYPSADVYRTRFESAADALVQRRLLLAEDSRTLLDRFSKQIRSAP